MNELYNKKLKTNARKLRKTMTKEERHLWYDCLKHLPITVHRQKILGNYIVDFYIAHPKIVIELDGSQHYEDNGIQYDAMRTNAFEERNLMVIRIPNKEVMRNFSGVCEHIDTCVRQRM